MRRYRRGWRGRLARKQRVGDAFLRLSQDDQREVLEIAPLAFDHLMQACCNIQERVNQAAKP